MTPPEPGIYSAKIERMTYPITSRSGVYHLLRVSFILGGRASGYRHQESFVIAPREASASQYAVEMGNANLARLKAVLDNTRPPDGQLLRIRLVHRKDKKGREWLNIQEYLPPITARKAKTDQRRIWSAFSDN